MHEIDFSKPVFVVNFKTYPQALGDRAIELANELIRNKSDKQLVIAPPIVELKKVIENVSDCPIIAQHVDFVELGAHTGHITPESVFEAGASGTLLNHSEKQLDLETIKHSIKRCREIGLPVIVCVPDPETAERVAAFRPDAIAFEPPELIGGNISVSTAEPEVIKSAVEKVHQVAHIPVLCGAGVHTSDDVSTALKLGARGVLVASGIVKSPYPGKALDDMLAGLD